LSRPDPILVSGASRWTKPLVRIALPIVAATAIFALATAFYYPTDVLRSNRSNAEPITPLQTGVAPADESIEAAMFVENGRREIALFPGTSLYLSDDARIETLELSASAARFSLLSGRVAAEIGGHEPNFRFVLSLPHAEAEARGTLFFARSDSNGTDEVQVLEGQVEVRGEPGNVSLVVSSSEAVIVKNGSVERSSNLHLLSDDICLIKGCEESTDTPTVASQKSKEPSVAETAVESAIAQGRLDDALKLVNEISAVSVPVNISTSIDSTQPIRRTARTAVCRATMLRFK
jgi:hypothetical protein